jgi:BirA family transcriptional regulator, biotin operon repressor / biotin---[acetyl-CoA-carboxylase] ligase
MIGRPRVHYRVTDSTNERAKELALQGAPHGTIVTADEQTAGRGRQGRTWVAPPGSALLMSVLLRDLGKAQAHLPLAAALAVCEACERAAPVSCRIKWPNDVWIEGRKVAGILIEGRPQEGWAVLGVGVNVSTHGDDFPPDLRDIATSIAAATEDANAPASGSLVLYLTQALDARLADRPKAIVASWRARDALEGQKVQWQSGEGVAEGINEDGALIVRTTSGRVFLDAGEVHLRRGVPPSG